MREDVSIRLITQATTATFSDLYFRLTFLFFIQAGSKRVLDSDNSAFLGRKGDLLIFPPGSVVTMENRPLLDENYRAVGVSFTDELIAEVFADSPRPVTQPSVQIVRAKPDAPMEVLPIIQATLEDLSLPTAIRRHRLLEPLIWLRDRGLMLPTLSKELPLSRVRSVIETDLERNWRATEVADRLAMSEATMRRWLAKSGHGFSKILLHTRLEHGLGLLQTTDIPISEIALDCGFKTPSHFSESFKKRFGIRPSEIRSART
ncbi:MAG: helix-turn-helix transcriptional regulator [Pseudomonadota bacterium]